jgi:arginine:ornithine antiporter/lysine permease
VIWWRIKVPRRQPFRLAMLLLSVAVCGFATIYAAAMIYGGGPKFLLLSAILYAPRRLLFFLAKRERKETVFKPLEAAMFAALAIAACAGVYALAAGAISI